MEKLLLRSGRRRRAQCQSVATYERLYAEQIDGRAPSHRPTPKDVDHEDVPDD
jgi:hypothetical protein